MAYQPLIEFFREIATEIQQGGGTPEQRDDAISFVMREIALTLGDMLAHQSGGVRTLEDFTATVREGFYDVRGEQQQ